MLSSPTPFPVPPDPTATAGSWAALSAIGTLSAAAITLLAVLVSILTTRFHLRREQYRDRQAQASYVTAWYYDAQAVIRVENRSERPIYDVGVSLLLPESISELPESASTLPDLAPAGQPHMSLKRAGGLIRVLPPRHYVYLSPGPYKEKYPVPVLAFRDANGVSWHRDGTGHLSELHVGIFEHFGVTSEYDYDFSSLQPLESSRQ